MQEETARLAERTKEMQQKDVETFINHAKVERERAESLARLEYLEATKSRQRRIEFEKMKRIESSERARRRRECEDEERMRAAREHEGRMRAARGHEGRMRAAREHEELVRAMREREYEKRLRELEYKKRSRAAAERDAYLRAIEVRRERDDFHRANAATARQLQWRQEEEKLQGERSKDRKRG